MRINLLNIETQGVDMKTNPLLLGNKKLHAATNLIFDEGTIRTRPGFVYSKTPASGQFQGAAEFRPRLGLSSNKLSELLGGVVIAADGDVWSGCNKIGSGFYCKGDVNLFQAENYLILQCREMPTFWWDGIGELVESPGMNEQDWNDPETPVQEVESVVPTAVIPECDSPPFESGIRVRFLVTDAAINLPLEGATWKVRLREKVAYKGVTGADGIIDFYPLPADYTLEVNMLEYQAIPPIPFVIVGEEVAYVWDECAPPVTRLVGDYNFMTGLNAIAIALIPTPCFVLTQATDTDYLGDFDVTQGIITLQNISGKDQEILSITTNRPSATITEMYPLLVPAGDFIDIYISDEDSLLGLTFTVNTSHSKCSLIDILFTGSYGAYVGLAISLFYSPSDTLCATGHSCDAAVFNVFANGLLLGTANLNNAIDGGYRGVTYTLDADQAVAIAGASTSGTTIDFEFICDPTFPGFNLAAYSGGCHPGIGHLTVTTALDIIVYDGCPAGPITIDIAALP